MEMSGEYKIPASRERVWDALNDPEVLKECIPGAKSLDQVSDTEMKATVQVKVGPVKAAFTGHVALSDIDPPNGYTITGESKGGPAGFAKGSADVKLAEEGPEATVLTYTAKAQVGGKLAQIGGRLVDATAKRMADQFFSAFAERLGVGASADDKGEEAVIDDVIGDPEVTAEAIEERLEIAAGRGVLGGPYVWGLIALLAVIVLIVIFR
ncbi:MAG: carbon monoxide dehydrogenase subunit G [Hyphomicrobiales bacterium]|nr:carbon monoxide dehydrogenase subunit G [Hyphomicrobiales bacterium]